MASVGGSAGGVKIGRAGSVAERTNPRNRLTTRRNGQRITPMVYLEGTQATRRLHICEFFVCHVRGVGDDPSNLQGQGVIETRTWFLELLPSVRSGVLPRGHLRSE